MRKIIVVEDNDADAKQLQSYIKTFGEEAKESFSVSRYSDAQTFLSEYVSADIVFLDIEMPGIDGMTAAKELRKKDGEVTIVFVTNMSQMAIQGYAVRAFDFILKPLSYKNFAVRFSRILKVLRKEEGKEIWIANKDGRKRIRTTDIRYVEIMRHVLVFHLEDEEVKATGTLLSLQKELEGECFSMCNRCYFVNLAFVAAVQGQVCVLDGAELQISRAKRKAFLKDLNDYVAMTGRK